MKLNFKGPCMDRQNHPISVVIRVRVWLHSDTARMESKVQKTIQSPEWQHNVTYMFHQTHYCYCQFRTLQCWSYCPRSLGTMDWSLDCSWSGIESVASQCVMSVTENCALWTWTSGIHCAAKDYSFSLALITLPLSSTRFRNCGLTADRNVGDLDETWFRHVTAQLFDRCGALQIVNLQPRFPLRSSALSNRRKSLTTLLFSW